MTGSVLILGPTGRFGRHAAEAFWNGGWRVSLFDRGRDDLVHAARGQDLIVNGWNPPYPRWSVDLPSLTKQVIAAARASGATVLSAANLYVYGAGSPELLGPDAPHNATNPLGRVRIQTEQMLRDSGIPLILLRAGDFLDTEPSGNWFDLVIAKDVRRGRMVWPGNPDLPHAWAWLPDLAQAALALANRRETLPLRTEVVFPGYTLSGHEIARLAGEVLDRRVSLMSMSWWPIMLAAPFWAMGRNLLEMRYLWDMPHRFDPAPFGALLPGFRPTAPVEALRHALIHEIDPEKPVAGRPAFA